MYRGYFLGWGDFRYGVYPRNINISCLHVPPNVKYKNIGMRVCLYLYSLEVGHFNIWGYKPDIFQKMSSSNNKMHNT